MKKKKLSLTLLGIILGCSIAFSGAYLFIKMFPNFQKLSKDYSREELLSETTGKQEVSGKISALRKKYALRGLIIDGESYLSNEQYGLALKNFSEALEDHPNNTFLLEKVGDTYFAMKKFEAAYNTYIKIPDPGETLKRNIFFSSLHAKGYKIHNHIDSLSLLINSLNFDTEESTYYKEIIKCSQDFHACKKSLESYIEKNKDSLKSEGFIDYKNTLTNYENFRLEDLYYKNTLLLGSMFKQKLYPLVISIGLNLNKEKPDYKPVLQMIAQSFYEIGEYKSAKAFLDMYLKYEPNDADGWYLMGVINMKLQEYILSNIQFNKAYELGFKEKLVVKRQIIFNLSILEQTERMLSELASIINNFDNYQKIDLYLAIYYHIIHDKTETALLIANKGSERFSSDPNLYGYYGWIYKEKGDLDTSLSYLQKGLEIDPKNPLVLLNLGYLFKEKGSQVRAKIYFTKLIESAPKSEFAKQAREEIEMMTQTEKNQAK